MALTFSNCGFFSSSIKRSSDRATVETSFIESIKETKYYSFSVTIETAFVSAEFLSIKATNISTFESTL